MAKFEEVWYFVSNLRSVSAPIFRLFLELFAGGCHNFGASKHAILTNVTIENARADHIFGNFVRGDFITSIPSALRHCSSSLNYCLLVKLVVSTSVELVVLTVSHFWKSLQRTKYLNFFIFFFFLFSPPDSESTTEMQIYLGLSLISFEINFKRVHGLRHNAKLTSQCEGH